MVKGSKCIPYKTMPPFPKILPHLTAKEILGNLLYQGQNTVTTMLYNFLIHVNIKHPQDLNIVGKNADCIEID